MKETDSTWICIVDNGRGRLLRATDAPPGRHHLEVDDSIENGWEEHQHGRPSPRAGKDGNSYASQGHEDEEKMKRFAREVVGWLEDKTTAQCIERLNLFAPPRFLGALRHAYSPGLAKVITEHEGDLGYMPPGELVQHHAISKLLG